MNEDDSQRESKSSARAGAGNWFVEHYSGALLILACVLATIIMTWPLPRVAGSAVQDLGDPLHQIWTMRWIQHNLFRDPWGMLDANIAYPFSMSLLFSEAKFSTSLIAWPIHALTGNEILMYNLMLLLTFFTTALGTALIVREITGNSGAGFLAGLVSAFTPYRYGHLSHLNLLNYGWMLLAAWALIRYGRTREPRFALAGGAFLLIQLHASDTLALMSIPVIGVTLLVVLWNARTSLQSRFLATTGAIIVVPWLTMIPTAIARFRLNELYGFRRDLDVIRESSASLSSYWSVYPGADLWSGILPTAYPNPLFPGAIALIGASIAIVFARGRHRTWTAGASALAAGGAILSLGPELTVAGVTAPLPYIFLFNYLPGFDAIRDVARFGMLALIGIHILAGVGFAVAWRHLREFAPVHYRAAAGLSLVALVSVFAIIEVRADVGVVHVDRSQDRLAVYEWLTEQPEGPILELPADGLMYDATIPIQQMYYSIFHWRPVFAIHASFVPPKHVELLTSFHAPLNGSSVVNQSNIGLVQDLGIRYLVIPHTDDHDWRRAIEAADAVPALERAGEFGAATAYTVASPEPDSIEFTFSPPEHAVAGERFATSILVENPHETSRIVSGVESGGIEITWRNLESGEVTSAMETTSLLTVEPQRTGVHVVTFDAPAEPGDYELVLDGGADRGQSESTVKVIPSSRLNYAQASVMAPAPGVFPGNISPGETFLFEADWIINEQFDLTHVMTVQLLDEDFVNVLDWNGAPFGDSYLLEAFAGGTTIRTVTAIPIPDDFPTGHYQILVAFYRYDDAEYPRASILLPDGSIQHEFIMDGVEVRD